MPKGMKDYIGKSGFCFSTHFGVFSIHEVYKQEFLAANFFDPAVCFWLFENHRMLVSDNLIISDQVLCYNHKIHFIKNHG